MLAPYTHAANDGGVLYQTPKNDDGMAAFVYAATRGGFNVALRDMDADETVPYFYHYECFNCAVARANELAPVCSQDAKS
jgi:hypothetical protein